MHVMRMCPAMARLGHSVALHVPRGTDLAVEDDFRYYGAERTFEIVKHTRHRVRVLGALHYAGSMPLYFRRLGWPDLFYAREVYSLGAVAKSGVPFCFESHWRPKNAVQLRLERWLLRQPNCRRVVFISEALRRVYAQLFPAFPEDKMLVAHDAADLRPEVTLDPERAAGGRLQVAYVGSFFAGYGIEMLPRLAQARPDCDFHVVGGDPEAVQAFKERFRQQTNLTFHGFVPPSQLAALYASFDVLVAPYQRSTPHIGWISPMKLFEYMAHGRAIVCADHQVLREILSDEQNALLVPAESLSAWCGAIDRLQDRELRAKLARSALERVRHEHTWDKRARDVLAGLD